VSLQYEIENSIILVHDALYLCVLYYCKSQASVNISHFILACLIIDLYIVTMQSCHA
jgi:hypothetical protein